jgi:ankyrin repeat protein
MRAEEEDREHVVKVLVKLKADSNAQDELGLTALHLAARKGRFRVIQPLLGAGVAVDVLDRERRTPLHHAATEGHVPVLKELLKGPQVADVNARDSLGQTSLHRAVSAGRSGKTPP